MNIFKKLSLLVLATFTVSVFALSTPTSAQLFQGAREEACAGASLTEDGGCRPQSNENTINRTIRTIINILSVVVGVVAVIMIIVAGFRFITSGGDANSVSAAKNAVLYALIGLILVALAQTIVKFVLNRVG